MHLEIVDIGLLGIEQPEMRLKNFPQTCFEHRIRDEHENRADVPSPHELVVLSSVVERNAEKYQRLHEQSSFPLVVGLSLEVVGQVLLLRNESFYRNFLLLKTFNFRLLKQFC